MSIKLTIASLCAVCLLQLGCIYAHGLKIKRMEIQMREDAVQNGSIIHHLMVKQFELMEELERLRDLFANSASTEI